jgi:hypothetical protein
MPHANWWFNRTQARHLFLWVVGERRKGFFDCRDVAARKSGGYLINVHGQIRNEEEALTVPAEPLLLPAIASIAVVRAGESNLR